jgi:hypothetical protein
VSRFALEAVALERTRMPGFAKILCSLALFVALGGTAHAAGTPQCDRVGAAQVRPRAAGYAVDLGVSTGWEGTSAVVALCTRP